VTDKIAFLCNHEKQVRCIFNGEQTTSLKFSMLAKSIRDKKFITSVTELYLNGEEA
jgi:hypothetical protein